MGNYININLDALQSAKSALARYINARNLLMAQLLGEVDHVKSSWRAADTDAFLTQWHAMSAPDGVFTVTKENLQKYKELLDAAYKLYKKAQSDSVEQASKISGWS